MKRYYFALAAAAATVAVAPRLVAQQATTTVASAAVLDTGTINLAEKLGITLPDSTPVDTLKKIAGLKDKPSKFMSMAPAVEMQNYRPEDKRGISVFEAPKDESVPYTGF